MARRMKVKLEGDEELKRKLNVLGERANASLLSAVRAGAEDLREEANRLAPSPDVVAGNEKVESGVAEISVGPREEKWYLRFFEFGAMTHEIKGTPLAFEGENGLVITRGVRHPGMPARPFLRPAIMQNKERIVQIIGSVFRREVDRMAG